MRCRAAAMLKRVAPGVPCAAKAGEMLKACLAIGLACTIVSSSGVSGLYFSGLVPEGLVAVSWGLWWLGDFCGIVIFGPIAWLIARFWKHYRTDFTPGPIIPAIFLNSTFAAAAVLAFMMLWNSETDKISQSLARESTAAAASVTQVLRAAKRELESIRAFLYASEHVSADEFRRYTTEESSNRIFETDAQGVEWIPWVNDPKAWETQMHNEDEAEVRLYKIDNSGKRIPVAQRDEYFPVQYVQPATGANLDAIGFDLGSEPLRRATLEFARDTGKMRMVAPIKLVQLDGPGPAMLIAVPVYRSDRLLDTVAARRANLTGFACGVYLISELFNNAMDANEVDVDLHLFDQALPVGSQLYHTKASPYRIHVEAATPASTIASLQEGLHGAAMINFADRNWLVVATPGVKYVQAHRTWMPWAVGLLLVSLGIALSSFLLERIAAHKNIEDERQRTEKALLEALAANESKTWRSLHCVPPKA